MKKKVLTNEYLINLWLTKYHNTTIEEVFSTPWRRSRLKGNKFFRKYPVTQEQHDEWNKEAKEIFRKHFSISKSYIDKAWGLTYLNTSPSVKD